MAGRRVYPGADGAAAGMAGGSGLKEAGNRVAGSDGPWLDVNRGGGILAIVCDGLS